MTIIGSTLASGRIELAMASKSKKASNPVALGTISLPRRKLSYRYVVNDAKIFLEKGSPFLTSSNFSIVLPYRNSESEDQQQVTLWYLQIHYSKIAKVSDLFPLGTPSQPEAKRYDTLSINLYQGSTDVHPILSRQQPRAQPTCIRESKIIISDCEFQIINSETEEIIFSKASESGSCLERNISNKSSGSCGRISVNYADIDNYLCHGTLTIQVQATLLCVTDPDESTHKQQKPLEDNVLAGVKTLFNDKAFADVMIKCGDAKFKAHKAILASQSPVFKKMLESDMKEQRTNVIEISDVDQAVISDMLAYLYTGSAPHMDTLLKELLNVANKYELPQLFAMCENQLKSEIKISNVIELLILADMHNAEHLKEACLNYFRHNSASVRSTSQWKELKKNCDRHALLLVEIMDYTYTLQ